MTLYGRLSYIVTAQFFGNARFHSKDKRLNAL